MSRWVERNGLQKWCWSPRTTAVLFIPSTKTGSELTGYQIMFNEFGGEKCSAAYYSCVVYTIHQNLLDTKPCSMNFAPLENWDWGGLQITQQSLKIVRYPIRYHPFLVERNISALNPSNIRRG